MELHAFAEEVDIEEEEGVPLPNHPASKWPLTSQNQSWLGVSRGVDHTPYLYSLSPPFCTTVLHKNNQAISIYTRIIKYYIILNSKYSQTSALFF
jgi:hypothetical protein